MHNYAVQGQPVHQMARPVQGQGPHNGGSSTDEEGGNCFGGGDDADFAGKSIQECPPYIRSGFIRKVYSILFVQLSVTAAVAMWFNTQLDPYWVRTHTSIYYGAVFGSMGMVMAMTCCCQGALRSFPTNYIFLAVFTLAMSVVVGFVGVMYTTASLLMALFTTAGVCGALTLYACFTKTDFTGMGPYLYAALMAMMFFNLVLWLYSMFDPTPMPLMHKIYAGCGVLLFSLYLVYDTQMVVGGNHKKHQFSVDDYAFAALTLYLDVVNLFLFILELLGNER